MAIALVGTPTTTNQAFGSSTIVVTYPTGHANKHVAYCFMLGTNTQSITATGWTQIGASANGTSGWVGYLMRRVLDGSEGASVTFTISGSANVLIAEMRLYSGVNTTTPEDGTSAGTNPKFNVGNTGQPSCTSMTTNTDGDWQVFFAVTNSGTRLYTAPTNYVNGATNNAGNGQGIGGWDFSQGTHGATGTVTCAGGTVGDAWEAGFVSLAPAPAGGGPADHTGSWRRRQSGH